MASLAHPIISGKTLSSPATLKPAGARRPAFGGDLRRVGTSWISSSSSQKLAGGKVAFATIPVLDGAGWSDDGMQSVVRVDPHQVQDWVAGLLNDQAEGKTEQLAYTPAKTTATWSTTPTSTAWPQRCQTC